MSKIVSNSSFVTFCPNEQNDVVKIKVVNMKVALSVMEKLQLTGRYCRWRGILYSSAGTAAWLCDKVKY